MNLIRNQQGIVMSADSFNTVKQPNYVRQSSLENTTRIYSTRNGHQMLGSEAKECVRMYLAEYMRMPKTMHIPTNLARFKKELEDEFNVSVVVIENKMPNSISLTQQGVPNEVKILLN